MAEKDQQTITIQYVADLLDSRFTIPGTRIKFGIDPILGLIPGAGDWFGGMLSIFFLIEAYRAGAGLSVIMRIFLNILIDIIIGSIPLIGDIFDVAWKANQRNARLIQDLHTVQEQTEKKSRWFMGVIILLLVGIIIGTLALIIWLISQLWAILVS